MKIVMRELVRCAALIYLLGAPWAIVSSRVEGLGVVLLLAGILPAGSFLFRALKSDFELELPERAEPSAPPRLRLVPSGTTDAAGRRDPDLRLGPPDHPTDWPLETRALQPWQRAPR